MATTNTQLLKAIKEAITEGREGMCPADKVTYEEHCSVLSQLKITLPRFESTLEKINEKMNKQAEALTILKTERRVLLGVAGMVSAIVAWLVKQI